MKLHQLARLLGSATAAESTADVTAVTEDSRRVKPGTVFFATKGEHADGHAYAPQAAAAGAVAIVGDRRSLAELCGVPYLYTPRPRRTLGLLAHQLAGNPSKQMTVIGVTGTNGKSSSVVMAQRVLGACGRPAAAFGTLWYDIAGQRFPARYTTPFAEELAGMFAQAREAGQTHVVMEVSSHALDQERVAGVDFDIAVFTNLSRDHLDYHKTMEDYLRAKLRLFERIEGAARFTVINADDPNAEAFMRASRVTWYTFGTEGDCRPRDVTVSPDRTLFVAETPWGTTSVEMRLIGKHNVLNALCVIAVSGGLGLPLDQVAEGIASLPSVPGRFERVDLGQPFQVVVDYAHTEDALRWALQAAREICSGRILAVFGCGGDRDKGKRAKMGQAAGELADFTVITSDNPRTEDPQSILLDIEPGMDQAGKHKNEDYVMILDRAEAIGHAIRIAQPGDVVLIAGKGHETYQILGAERIHFDDREVAREALKSL